MKINLSKYNPRKIEQTITKVSTPTRNITLEYLTEIYLNLDAIHVMKEDTLLEIFLKIKMVLKRRISTEEDIMLTLQRMMILPGKDSNKKVKTLQVMKNMF